MKIKFGKEFRRTLANVVPRLFTIGSYSMWPKITFAIPIAFLIEFPENSIRITARGYNIGHPSRILSDAKWKSRLIPSVDFACVTFILPSIHIAWLLLLLRHGTDYL